MLKKIQENKIGYKYLLNEKNYLLYLLAGLISRFGDSIDTIAYGWMVYEVTGKTTLMALLFGINGLPTILFEPIAGVFVSHKKKKNILVICNFGRATLVLITTLMFLLGTLKSYHLFIFTFINSTFEAFQSPASLASVPLILEEDKYAYGISLSATLSRVVELLGLVVASGIIASIGISGGMMINALSFYVCGILMCLIRYKKENILKQTINITNYLSDLKEGFSYMRNTKVVLSICLFGAFFSILLIPFNTLNIDYIGTELKLGTNAVALCSLTVTLGMIVGSFIFPKLKEKIKGINLFVLSGIILGFTYFGFSLFKIIDNSNLVYTFLSLNCIVFGISAGIMLTLINVAFMKNVKQELLSRVGGVFNALVMSATPLGSLLVASLCNFFNTSQLFLLFGIATILLFIFQIFNKELQDI